MQDSGWRKYSQAADQSGTEHAELKDRRNGSVVISGSGISRFSTSYSKHCKAHPIAKEQGHFIYEKSKSTGQIHCWRESRELLCSECPRVLRYCMGPSF